MRDRRIRNLLKRGDDVEIRFATHDGPIWHLASVLYVDADGIKVQYPSGHEKMLEHGSGEYRLPKRRA